MSDNARHDDRQTEGTARASGGRVDTARGRARGYSERERGTSEVVGVVLMLGLVLLGMTATLVVASAAITDMEGTVNVGQAQNAMRALDGEVSDVGFGMQSTGHVDVGGTAGTYAVRENAGHITIRHVGYENSHDVVLYQSDMGAVTYDHAGTTIGYQMGGLWKQTGDSDESAMVSRPNIQFRNQTFTMPLVRVTGDGSMSGGSLNVETPVGARSRVYPSSTATYPDGTTYSNPLHGGGEIEIEVQSEYYRAWGRFLESELNSTATYDHGTNTVTVAVTVWDDESVTEDGGGGGGGGDGRVAGGVFGAVTTSDVGDAMRVQDTSYIDSYDSDEGTYADTKSDNGNISIGNSLRADGEDITIEGNINSSGYVELGENAQVTGDLAYGTSCTACDPSKVDGTISATGNGPSLSPADDYIDDRIADIAADNDNAGHEATLDNMENTNCASTCTLTAGDYHLEHIHLNGGEQKVVLDTRDGPINLSLYSTDSRSVRLKSGAWIEVIGPHRVNIYGASNDAGFEMNGDGRIEVDADDDGTRDYRAAQVWVYGKSTADLELQSHSGTTGVFYMPRGTSGDSRITMNIDSHVYGAVVGYIEKMKSGSAVHYDEALSRTWAIPENAPAGGGGDDHGNTDSATPETMMFIHLSENEVVVEPD
ncbi:polymer-forming cytoskeletal protein [Haloarcula marina]|uniref:polymer-forming cytoskeletal protein n=1 Tax=Haloarcula marina TaxID=2961574 RepID=UPI0020B87804|nr:polymer-forming cytoskeletal protein [Halomicroarcula marina]